MKGAQNLDLFAFFVCGDAQARIFISSLQAGAQIIVFSFFVDNGKISSFPSFQVGAKHIFSPSMQMGKI